MKLMVVLPMFVMGQEPVMCKNQAMEAVLFVELVQIVILLVNIILILKQIQDVLHVLFAQEVKLELAQMQPLIQIGEQDYMVV